MQEKNMGDDYSSSKSVDACDSVGHIKSFVYTRTSRSWALLLQGWLWDNITVLSNSQCANYPLRRGPSGTNRISPIFSWSFSQQKRLTNHWMCITNKWIHQFLIYVSCMNILFHVLDVHRLCLNPSIKQI